LPVKDGEADFDADVVDVVFVVDGSRPLRRRRRVRLGLWVVDVEDTGPQIPPAPSGSSSEAEVEDVEEVDDDRSNGLTAIHVVSVYTVSVGKDRIPSVFLFAVAEANASADVGDMGYASGLVMVDESSTRAASWMPRMVGGTVRTSIRPLGGLALFLGRTGVAARADCCGCDWGCFCTPMARGLTVPAQPLTVELAVEDDAPEDEDCVLRFFLVG